MNSLDSQDPDKIQESVRRLSDLRATPQRRTSWTQSTPYDHTPYDTPLRTPRAGGESQAGPSRPKIDMSLSLDAFQAKYTSEDNSSFTEILDEENQQRRQRYGWAWEAERRAGERKAKEIQGRERLLLVAADQAQRLLTGSSTLAIGPAKDILGSEESSEPVESGTGIEMQALVLANKDDESAEPVDVMAPRKDTRSAIIPSWKFRVRHPSICMKYKY